MLGLPFSLCLLNLKTPPQPSTGLISPCKPSWPVKRWITPGAFNSTVLSCKRGEACELQKSLSLALQTVRGFEYGILGLWKRQRS